MFKHILIPLDGSACAEGALSVAARIARASGSSLTLIHVVSTLNEITWSSIKIAINTAHILERERSKANEYLHTIATSEDLKGIEVHTCVTDGDPANAILSNRHDADLIVICTDESGGLKHWIQGNVSHKVTRHSAIPVLLLHSQDNSLAIATQKETKPIRILVPLDGSPLAEEALPPAIALTKALSAPNAGAIHLASIITFFAAEFVGIDDDILIKAVHTYLASVEQRLLQSGEATDLTITTSVTQSLDTVQTLVHLAETGSEVKRTNDVAGCDMIAMATHGGSGIARWIIGSVTEHVLHSTTRPMLIVRPKEINIQQQQGSCYTNKQ